LKQRESIINAILLEANQYQQNNMWFYNFILITGLTVIFSETPNLDCGYSQKTVGGCYREKQKEIIINYQNPNETLYHELGHAKFLHNEEINAIIKKYPQPNSYDRKIYDTEDKILDEKVADYFVEYRFNPESLKIFYPEIYKSFENSLK